MNKIKFQKGITLIALIITVVLLIILAAVTIGSVKETDVIGYAQNAAEEYEEKQNEEQGKVSEYKEQIKDVLGASHVTGKVTVDVIAKKNSTINGNVPSSTNPVIPAGFKAINVTTPGHESSWDAEGGPEVEKGLVIEDEDENQFVWVPVPDIAKFAKLQSGSDVDYEGILYDFTTTPPTVMKEQSNEVGAKGSREPDVLTELYNPETKKWEDFSTSNIDTIYLEEKVEMPKGSTSDDFKIQLQKEFNEMAASVAKYKGFYVGRYETSINETKTQSKYGAISVTAADNDNTWYGLYKINKKYTTSSVKSSMIWGSQYDAMMIWMEDDATNFDTNNRNEGRETGSKSEDVIRNVYDLGGNSLEWTLEAYDTFIRIARGGTSSSYDYLPSSRSTNAANAGGNSYGSRLTLYIV